MVVVTNFFIRLITAAENGIMNGSYLAKKGLCVILLQNLQTIVSEYLSPSNEMNTLTPTLSVRIDETFLNIFTLLTKLSKSEPKLALLARSIVFLH